MSMRIFSGSTGRHVFGLTVLLFALIAVLIVLPHPARSDTSSLSGYAWSDTIGWISFNCSNTNSCGTSNYALTVGSAGTLSGYAWSDSVGWISANASDLAGCPSGTCTANLVNGVLTGWLKALSGGSVGSGGWDGWIRLDGTNYGPVQTSAGVFSGYAWGSDVVGWIDFSQAIGVCTPVYTCSGNIIQYTNSSCAISTVTTCVAPTFCSAGSSSCLVAAPVFNASSGGYTGHLQVAPLLVRKGGTATVYWNVSNASCTVSGNGDSWSGNSSGASGKTTSPITQQITYTLSCTGDNGVSIHETQTVHNPPEFQEL